MLSRHHYRHILCTAALLLLGVSALAAPRVKPGIEVLRDHGFAGLEGKRVGLVTNPSGVDSRLNSTIDILFEALNVKLVALYAPEHGVRGDVYAGGKVESGKDEHTGLPVHSLFGSTRQPTREMLQGVDIMVYDIQDVGSRSYTFISTLGLVMRTCAEMGIPVMVLDRPNPLGGNKVEGPLVRDGYHSFVSQYKIPYIYGLTVGELATLINEEGLNCGQNGKAAPLKCKLTVIPMEGWTRDMLFGDTGLPWILPSPNIPYAETAICYPSAGLCGEMYNYLNIGIGYTLPFATFAEEWVDADKLKASIEKYNGYCANGVDEEFGKDAQYLFPLESGPYYAFELYAGIFTTVGGMKITPDAQVLDADAKPVPHLYAIGCDAGGIYGDSYDVSICEGSCQGFAVFSGKAAAEHIAANA